MIARNNVAFFIDTQASVRIAVERKADIQLVLNHILL